MADMTLDATNSRHAGLLGLRVAVSAARELHR